ncbi:MAG: hypothetical protein HYW86_01225 [Candidatus Roizmanbacteria bacterium]|nr:MAG: hypothetical protein HYW86_01225 [Candidatus Roizmanbacteria bacterium]
MTDFPIQSSIFILQIAVLYFVSRITIQEIFRFFYFFTSNRKIIFSLMSLVLLPGTALHEIAHFIMATILMMRVKEVKIIPEWEGNSIKLGRVLYEKKDAVRGIIVGIAPILAGIFFFWFAAQIGRDINNNLGLNILLVYLIFIISSTMFSSKQDLIDIIFTIPFFLVIIGGAYILNIPIIKIIQNFLPKLDSGLVIINRFLFYSLAIHIVIIVSFKSFKRVLKK